MQPRLPSIWRKNRDCIGNFTKTVYLVNYIEIIFSIKSYIYHICICIYTVNQFDGKFFAVGENFRNFHTMCANERTSHRNYRRINFTKYFSVRVDFFKFHTAQYGKTINSLSLKKSSSNQLFSNFFSKSIAFTKFLRKKRDREFP